MLYHKDIGFPGGLRQPFAGLRLTFGSHARDQAKRKGLPYDLPRALPARFTLVEAEVVNGETVKWVVRWALPNDDRDIVCVVQPDGFVRTVWANHGMDLHLTLNRALYTEP